MSNLILASSDFPSFYDGYVLRAFYRYDDVIGVKESDFGSNPDSKKGESDSHAEVGALCNAAKYVAAEAAFEACERAGSLIHLFAFYKLNSYILQSWCMGAWATPLNFTLKGMRVCYDPRKASSCVILS